MKISWELNGKKNGVQIQKVVIVLYTVPWKVFVLFLVEILSVYDYINANNFDILVIQIAF